MPIPSTADETVLNSRRLRTNFLGSFLAVYGDAISFIRLGKHSTRLIINVTYIALSLKLPYLKSKYPATKQIAVNITNKIALIILQIFIAGILFIVKVFALIVDNTTLCAYAHLGNAIFEKTYRVVLDGGKFVALGVDKTLLVHI